jgi:hypothetical protein
MGTVNRGMEFGFGDSDQVKTFFDRNPSFYSLVRAPHGARKQVLRARVPEPVDATEPLCCGLLLYGGGGLGAYGADCLVDDDVEELVVVGSGFFLDDLAHALAGSGVVGQAEAALFSG